MNEQEQRIAIAEFCGWKPTGHFCYTTPNTKRPTFIKDGVAQIDLDLPDYCNDLNAMHEAWEALSFSQQAQFADELQSVMGLGSHACGWIKLIGATAAQRAEALLRTIGKWED